jgi:hypothetical protein
MAGAQCLKGRAQMTVRQFLRWIPALILGISAAQTSSASHPSSKKVSDVSKLMVVLREMEGQNKKDSELRLVGKVKAIIDGKEVEMSPAWFGLIGDMIIRFVYDEPATMLNLSEEELSALHLTPDKALEIAMENVKRTYGKPHYSPWANGLFVVEGGSADLDSSYFLDLEFWLGLLKEHPEGLIVGVPKRGGLLFAPASDVTAVENFRRGIIPLFETSENMRVSSALYLFKDKRWSVFQDPETTH